MTPPRTSSREQQAFFSALGLQVELQAEASGELSEVVSALIGWYADSARAAEAKVFALTGRQPPPREVLAGWVGRVLPADAEGDALIGYAADALLIAGDHGASPSALQLMVFESGDAGLYLLRPQTQRKLLGAEGWVPMTLHSPDTEAALSGIYRYEGCTRAFTEHARGCEACLAALEEWDFEHGLPAGFDEFRRALPAKRKPRMEEGEPEEGVAIFIPRPPPEPPKQAPWWKFWG
ncbi:MAG: hypothetical protein Q8N23_04840 [Archangium sp.]|nr:hypothetical protein [Archangium sp.]MDP3571384.1 hypothetical protein [Archangium sp.]